MKWFHVFSAFCVSLVYGKTTNSKLKGGKERKGTLFKCLVDLALEH